MASGGVFTGRVGVSRAALRGTQASQSSLIRKSTTAINHRPGRKLSEESDVTDDPRSPAIARTIRPTWAACARARVVQLGGVLARSARRGRRSGRVLLLYTGLALAMM